MAEQGQQALVVLAFAAVLLGANLKAGVAWLKVVTLWSALAALAFAAWLILGWVRGG